MVIVCMKFFTDELALVTGAVAAGAAVGVLDAVCAVVEAFISSFGPFG
jgi:hypothetical protein